MASTQCPQPVANETCQQKCHNSSLSQKVSEMASWVTGNHRGQGQCDSGAKAQSYPHHATSKTETHCYSQSQTTHHTAHSDCLDKVSGGHSHDRKSHNHGHKATNGVGTTCHGKTKKKGEHKNLLHKIKDKVSGNSSSDSSSESESDNEGCHKRKN